MPRFLHSADRRARYPIGISRMPPVDRIGSAMKAQREPTVWPARGVRGRGEVGQRREPCPTGAQRAGTTRRTVDQVPGIVALGLPVVRAVGLAERRLERVGRGEHELAGHNGPAAAPAGAECRGGGATRQAVCERARKGTFRWSDLSAREQIHQGRTRESGRTVRAGKRDNLELAGAALGDLDGRLGRLGACREQGRAYRRVSDRRHRLQEGRRGAPVLRKNVLSSGAGHRLVSRSARSATGSEMNDDSRWSSLPIWLEMTSTISGCEWPRIDDICPEVKSRIFRPDSEYT